MRTLFHRLGYGCVVNTGQDAREAIAAAADQRHIRTTGGRAVDGRNARGVVTRKAQVAAQRVGIHFDLVAHAFQAFDGALERSLVAHRAGGRVHINVLGACAVVVAAAAIVVRVIMVIVAAVLAVGMVMATVVVMTMRVLVRVFVVNDRGGGCFFLAGLRQGLSCHCGGHAPYKSSVARRLSLLKHPSIP